MTGTSPTQVIGGRYEVTRILGAGGMATVFLTTDKRLGVERAVKVLNPRYATVPQIRERFETEAHAQARLRHPNILMVHDVVEMNGGIFMVMELAEGGSLNAVVQDQGPLGPRRAVEVIIDVLKALAVAHGQDFVHRDIKPENILLDANDTVKLADFGIARVVDRHANQTRTGMAMGTWAYMPPEQRNDAKSVDARADIYATGAALYFLVTGREPFDLHNVESHEVAFSGFPDELEDVIKGATRFFAADRYESAVAMRKALEEIVAELPADPVFEATEKRVKTVDIPSADPADTLAPFFMDHGEDAQEEPVTDERSSVTLAPVGLLSEPAVDETTDVRQTRLSSVERTGRTAGTDPLVTATIPRVGGGVPAWLVGLGMVTVLGVGFLAFRAGGQGQSVEGPPGSITDPLPVEPAGPDATDTEPPTEDPKEGDVPKTADPKTTDPKPTTTKVVTTDRPKEPASGPKPKPPATTKVAVKEPTPAADHKPAPVEPPPPEEPAVPTVKVRFISDPYGAKITVDGRPFGIADKTARPLAAGEQHIVTFTSAEGDSQTFPVELGEGDDGRIICYSFDPDRPCP